MFHGEVFNSFLYVVKTHSGFVFLATLPSHCTETCILVLYVFVTYNGACNFVVPFDFFTNAVNKHPKLLQLTAIILTVLEPYLLIVVTRISFLS